MTTQEWIQQQPIKNLETAIKGVRAILNDPGIRPDREAHWKAVLRDHKRTLRQLQQKGA